MNKSVNVEECLLIQCILASNRSRKDSDNNDPLTRISWLEKYFLIRVIHIFGADITIEKSMDVLVPILGISYKNICQAQKVLSALGIVTLEVVAKDRGRPVNGFHIHGEQILESFEDNALKNEPFNHQLLIDSLVCWGDDNIDAYLDLGEGANSRSKRAYLKDDNHDLDGKSRLFLAILLVHADEFGFVESIGQADIEAMSGFTPDQQRRLVRVLMKKCYIRSVIKGFTNPKLFGRVETVYCLNISRSVDLCQQLLKITLFVSVEGIQANELSESSQLCRITRPRRLGSQSIERPRQLLVRAIAGCNDRGLNFNHFPIESFTVFNNRSLVDYLQFRLERYATWFLEKSDFNDRGADIVDSHYDEVLQKIMRDIFHNDEKNSKPDNLKSKDIPSEQVSGQVVANILCTTACAMAKQYYQFLSMHCPESLMVNKRRLRVFPRLYKTPVFESLSLAIASLSQDQMSVEYQDTRYYYVRDNRLNIEKHRKQLFKNSIDGRLRREEYDIQLVELESSPNFSKIPYAKEDDIDENIRRYCGLIS